MLSSSRTGRSRWCSAFGLVIVFAGCSGADESSAGLVGELDRLSVVWEGDEIHVRSPVSPADSFWGTRLPATFDPELRPFYPRAVRGGFYATFTVNLGRARRGYLLRVPGPYATSAIDLFVLSEDQALAPPVRVADNYSTGSGQVVIRSALVDVTGDGVRDLVQRKRVFWTDDDLVDRAADSLFVRSWEEDGFAEPRPAPDSLVTVLGDSLDRGR